MDDKIKNLAMPIAVVIAGVLISGSVLYANKNNQIAQIGDGQPKTGTIQFGIPELKKWASTIKGLDKKAFNACLDSGKYEQHVQDVHASGEALGMVNENAGTPTFFVNGVMVQPQGAQPYEVFQKAIDAI